MVIFITWLMIPDKYMWAGNKRIIWDNTLAYFYICQTLEHHFVDPLTDPNKWTIISTDQCFFCSRSGVIRRLHGFTYTWQNHLNSRSTSLACDSLHEKIEFLFYSAGCWSSPSFWSALTRKSVCQMSKYCAFGGFIFLLMLNCLAVLLCMWWKCCEEPHLLRPKTTRRKQLTYVFFTRWLICHLIRSLVVSQERVKHQEVNLLMS